jgi:hypothetical protein
MLSPFGAENRETKNERGDLFTIAQRQALRRIVESEYP